MRVRSWTVQLKCQMEGVTFFQMVRPVFVQKVLSLMSIHESVR